MSLLRHIPNDSGSASLQERDSVPPELDDAFGQLIAMGLFLNDMLEKLGLTPRELIPPAMK